MTPRDLVLMAGTYSAVAADTQSPSPSESASAVPLLLGQAQPRENVAIVGNRETARRRIHRSRPIPLRRSTLDCRLDLVTEGKPKCACSRLL